MAALTIPAAAAALGVSVWTVRREIGRGRLRAFRVGRVYRIDPAELDAYRDGRRVVAALPRRVPGGRRKLAGLTRHFR